MACFFKELFVSNITFNGSWNIHVDEESVGRLWLKSK
jgi:hypothetical protein